MIPMCVRAHILLHYINTYSSCRIKKKKFWINIKRVIKLFKKSYYIRLVARSVCVYNIQFNAFVEFMYI